MSALSPRSVTSRELATQLSLGTVTVESLSSPTLDTEIARIDALETDVTQAQTDITANATGITANETAITATQADVLDLEQGCFVSAWTGAASIPTATVTNVDWVNIDEASNGAWHSGATPNRLTVPVTGFYRPTASAVYAAGTLTAGTTRVALWIWSNRYSAMGGDDKIAPATGTWLSAAAPARYMEAGDYFVAQAFQNSGSTRNVAVYMSVELVGLGD